MPSKNVPLYLPQELSNQIDHAARVLDLPQSQCMRLSLQFGLPELLRRLSREKKEKQLPRQAKRAWSAKKFHNIDLDQACISYEELDEDLL